MNAADIFTQVLGAGFDPFTQLDQLLLSKQVELARALGDARFASDCAHEQVKNGHCVVCLRKVLGAE